MFLLASHTPFLKKKGGNFCGSYEWLHSFQWLYQWQTEDVFVYPSVIVYSVMLSVGLMLFLAAFIIFPIRERLTNAKQVRTHDKDNDF